MLCGYRPPQPLVVNMCGVRSVLCLLLLGLVFGGVEVQAQESIKMCGRDLIRHAVSYCGNSRLKRAVMKIEAPSIQQGAKWDLTSPGLEDSSSVRSGSEDSTDLEALVSHWLPLSARMRRTALKISDLCCEKGCSKRELIQFC